MAADDLGPARTMAEAQRKLRRRWEDNFDRAGRRLARWFVSGVARRTDASIAASLKDVGLGVQFKMTRAATDVLNASMAEQVSLIKSIASQHLSEVEGIVMRAFTQGRKLDELTDELHERYGVTRRRAAFIARDQSNKATATLTRVRQQEAGIAEAVWMHSRGGKHPRESHVRFSGQKYSVTDGALIDGKRIWPGTEINCRCFAKPVIPGFD